jgi:hypothetical protein
MTGDARPGAIVEARSYDDDAGRKRLSLATRSNLTIEAQIAAPGATWLDRQLLAKESALSNTLRQRELGDAAARLSAETGLAHRPSAEGEHVSGIYR